MLRAAAIFAALIALAPPTRGDAGPVDVPPPLYTITSSGPVTIRVHRWDLSPLGLTNSYNQTVWIDDTLTGGALRTVCAHELGHVLCGAAHETDRACWMYPSTGRDAEPTWWPCEAELGRAKGTYRLHIPTSLPGNVQRGVRWAMATWNCALKRDALVEAR